MPEFQQIYPQEHERLTGDARPVFEQGNKHMFRHELVRIKMPRLFLGVNGQYTMRPLG
jgi:hypothetical protein